MALIYCPECGTQVSDKAETCIKCFYPMTKLVHSISHDNINKNAIDENVNCLEYYYNKAYSEIHYKDIELEDKRNWFSFIFKWVYYFVKILILILGIFITILIGKRGARIFNKMKLNYNFFSTK